MPTSEQEAHALIQAIDELLDATGLGRVELILRKVGPNRYLARFALELPNRGGSITYTPPEETAGPLVEACQAASRRFQEEWGKRYAPVADALAATDSLPRPTRNRGGDDTCAII